MSIDPKQRLAVLHVEYDGRIDFIGPYSQPDAEAVAEYAMGSDRPMGDCVVEVHELLPPITVDELESEDD